MSAVWPTAAETTLADLVRDWGCIYHLEFAGGAYRARHWSGTVLPPASTPEGLRLALQADRWRRLGGGR